MTLLRHPATVRVSAFCFAKLVQLLFRTLRLDVRTTELANPYAATGDQRFIYAVWHDSIVMAAFGGKHVRTVALTSQHRDGSFVANTLAAIGVPSLRGSTGHGGGSALRTLLTTASDQDVVLTPDGPRGPRRQMSLGTVFLASRSGRAIVPTSFRCRRSWAIRGSWTDLVIPRPFSHVYLLAGEPIDVPPELTREQLTGYVDRVQQQMDLLNQRAELLLTERAS